MDEKTRQLIEAYLPNPRDETLEDGEYYFKQDTAGGERIIRVFALDIFPYQDGTEYGLYQNRGGRLIWIDSRGDGDHCRGVTMGHLYDNKQDCKDATHWWYDRWEELRKIQREEMETKWQ